jgi:Tol biopolymer transport system component
LTSHKQWIFGFDWTQDGRKIVYSSGVIAETSLSMISVSGGTPERLSAAAQGAMALSASRTGSRLVYERDRFDFNIWRIPGPNSSPDMANSPFRLIASTQTDMEPQFSPDGGKIAFNSSRSGNYEIWICDLECRNPAQLTSFSGPPVGSPRWSPDSRWIAFDSTKNGNSDVYIISADGGPVRRITDGPPNNARPSWSADGRWIYFGSNRSGDLQIWKTSAQGGAAVQVTKKGGEEAFESPDGKFVYYAKLGTPGIWKISAAGGEEIKVLDEGREDLWALATPGICLFDLSDPGKVALKFFSFADAKIKVLREFSKETTIDPYSTALSISPDGRWILYTQLDHSGSDLMMVEDFY